MSADSTLEKALNRLLWKMPKPPGCETAEDAGLWMQAELRDAGVSVSWHPTEQRMVEGILAFSNPTGQFVKVETQFEMPPDAELAASRSYGRGFYQIDEPPDPDQA